MKITTGTIVRTIILALALFNQVMSATGHAVLPISDETVETTVSVVVTIVTAVIAWWKNNSFTMPARIGDFHMNQARLQIREEKRLNGKDE